VVAASTGGSVAGTIPLYAYNRTYDAQHWDFAAVASPQGIAWATAAGYTRSILLGYVFSQPPTPCGGAGGGAGGTFTMGLSAAVPSIPAGWEYSTLFSVAEGGPTAAVYAWGNALQTYYSTSRIPSVTLTDLGYYSDDGGYYYVWEAYNIPARPWPAEVGMVLVKEDLWARGVPVAYMQLDVSGKDAGVGAALPFSLLYTLSRLRSNTHTHTHRRTGGIMVSSTVGT
jgi:hypothetical protein